MVRNIIFFFRVDDMSFETTLCQPNIPPQREHGRMRSLSPPASRFQGTVDMRLGGTSSARQPRTRTQGPPRPRNPTWIDYLCSGLPVFGVCLETARLFSGDRVQEGNFLRAGQTGRAVNSSIAKDPVWLERPHHRQEQRFCRNPCGF
ncbi:hypothetical protein B5X24_HaOG217272 [Helicoverpa armigera]|uniref:Uncharacterized protein n=1 Tax=Helicoverpa armigera TaxID=29058 RepID=A0A2W1BUF6_HELAM|nr:hypothetical protein B5X24_HaOG217272 [Helicoverpa armigera]